MPTTVRDNIKQEVGNLNTNLRIHTKTVDKQNKLTDDIEKIKEAKKELEQASWKVSQQAYQSGGSSDDSSNNEEKKEEEKK